MGRSRCVPATLLRKRQQRIQMRRFFPGRSLLAKSRPGAPLSARCVVAICCRDMCRNTHRAFSTSASVCRTDIQTVMIVGAGPIVIGQACEFDYSGTQACKALKAEGFKVILLNSNPATIMTDPGTADRTYIGPMTPELVEQVQPRNTLAASTARLCSELYLHLPMAQVDSRARLVHACDCRFLRRRNRTRFSPPWEARQA